MSAGSLLAVEGVSKRYALPKTRLFERPPLLEAVAGVSLSLAAGESLGLVGESGSGKSTLARLVMGFEPPSAGRVWFDGADLAMLPAAALRRLRARFQMVFQDPYGSLDPRHRVGRIVREPLHAAPAADAAARAEEALRAVGLSASDLDRYPHEFSGGQRQRIAIARALVTRPDLIVADEPVSALDVSVQAQVLNLLRDLQAQHRMSYLLISHDLAVVEYVCARVAVMYRGRIVEQGAAATILRQPRHPYTQALRDAVPRLEPGRRRRRRAASASPATGAPAPAGCGHAGRCPLETARCRQERPALRPIGEDHEVACHLA